MIYLDWKFFWTAEKCRFNRRTGAQEKKLWEATIQKTVCPKSHSTELYFEERNIEAFAEKLNNYEEPVKYVTPLTCNAWERKVIRFYDPDGTLIEVGETR